MAALSITTASVVWVSGTAPINAQFGGTVTAGEPCYLSAGQYFPAQSTVAGKSAPTVLALTGGTVGQYGMFAGPGATVAIGATVVTATAYYQGSTAGAINPIGDVTTGWLVVIIGVGNGTTNMNLLFTNTALQL